MATDVGDITDELEEPLEEPSRPSRQRQPILSGWCMTGYHRTCRRGRCECQECADEHGVDFSPSDEPHVSPALAAIMEKYA